MKNTLAILSTLLFFYSCEQPKNVEKITENAEGEITIGKNFVVDRPLAIIILPTDESLALKKKEIGENNYRIYYDDGASIINDANTVLEKNKIETIERLNNEIITFSTTDGKLFDVNLTDKEFTTLLFNGKEAPKELFSNELESDESIVNYMK